MQRNAHKGADKAAIPQNPVDLVVGISTTAQRAKALNFDSLPAHEGVHYFIAIQSLTKDTKAADWAQPELMRDDITVHLIAGTGVCKSRNYILHRANAKWLWFCDDDLEYTTHFFEDLINGFNASPGYALLAFTSKNGAGQNRKSFAAEAHDLTLFNSAKYATFEMAIALAPIVNAKIQFDEDFGVGSRYAFGDEYIFISDVIKSGLKARFLPIDGAAHPGDSTAFRHIKDRPRIERAVMRRVFKGWGLLIWSGYKIRNLLRKVKIRKVKT